MFATSRLGQELKVRVWGVGLLAPPQGRSAGGVWRFACPFRGKESGRCVACRSGGGGGAAEGHNLLHAGSWS